MKYSARFMHIFESIQYGILYMLAAFAGGVGLDFIYPAFDAKKPIWKVFRETVSQCLALIIVVYVIRYFIKQVPLLISFSASRNYVPYQTSEFNGEMMMGFVFLSSQLNLLQKIDLLSDKLYLYLFKEEHDIEDGVEKEAKKIENGFLKRMTIHK